MIDVYDDFFTEEELDFVIEYCVDAPYFYGETDNDDTPVTGLVHNIWVDGMNEDENTWRKNLLKTTWITPLLTLKNSMLCLSIELRKSLKNVIKRVSLRIYINCFSPKDESIFSSLMKMKKRCKNIFVLYNTRMGC